MSYPEFSKLIKSFCRISRDALASKHLFKQFCIALGSLNPNILFEYLKSIITVI